VRIREGSALGSAEAWDPLPPAVGRRKPWMGGGSAGQDFPPTRLISNRRRQKAVRLAVVSDGV